MVCGGTGVAAPLRFGHNRRMARNGYQEESRMSYTIWSKAYGSNTWHFCGLQSDSEKVAVQSFDMYRLAPGESIQLRDPAGIVMDERVDMTRPHAASPE